MSFISWSDVPGWFVFLVLVILVWNGVHSFIEFRQKKRQLDIEMYGKSVTAVVHEHNRARQGMPLIPGAMDSLVASRSIASPASSLASVAVATPQVVAPSSVAVPSAASVSSASSTGAPDPALPVVTGDVLNPIDTLRMPFAKDCELLICGYPGPASSGVVVAFRVAFVRFSGTQKMLGTYRADEKEDFVIDDAMQKAGEIVRSSAKSAASASAKRSAAAV